MFSVDQRDGLPEDLVAPLPPASERLIRPEGEALIRRSGAEVRLDGELAFYAPGLDYIQLPRPESFFKAIHWHRTALHELGHWTGAPHRLARDLSHRFGTSGYAREELVAEMCAAFACAALESCPRCATPTTSPTG